jgi:hypothetical protein
MEYHQHFNFIPNFFSVATSRNWVSLPRLLGVWNPHFASRAFAVQDAADQHSLKASPEICLGVQSLGINSPIELGIWGIIKLYYIYIYSILELTQEFMNYSRGQPGQPIYCLWFIASGVPCIRGLSPHGPGGQVPGSRRISPAPRIRFTHWVGLRENLQETPIFNGKNHGFL